MDDQGHSDLANARMRLTTLYVRFFRSFNFDYERKAHPESRPAAWEYIDGAWFPFVRIPLDPVVTAVVGANESGKSHLIEALKQALTGEGIDRTDFCRYSPLFSVELGQVRRPDFGIELMAETTDDVDQLASCGIETQVSGMVRLLRLGGEELSLIEDSGEIRAIEADAVATLGPLLPKPFELKTNVAIPDSISLDALTGRDWGPLSPRKTRSSVVDLLQTVSATADAIRERADQISEAITATPGRLESDLEAEELGRTLLLEVANIDVESFRELDQALRDGGEEGRVGGLVEKMNRSLARHLNFERWWRQDRDFQLRVDPRERELVFTIRDRTGTDYSFSERSRGLQYFLGYFVQLVARRGSAARSEVSEILLMDEPDAYLSSMGQQDLLRALEDFARPEDRSRKDQVVYVTHSPFLINKNAAHRLRVLDKGSNEEGTRVVRDAARNHYEPLRSAVGSYVAETAFIGGTNLLVEGIADQILLNGLTSLLRYRQVRDRDLLDLNEVTIVAAGSASTVPYVAYLARGRDETKPPCVALLDGDEAGRDARKKLLRDVVNRKPILRQEYVVDLASWAATTDLDLDSRVQVIAIEDLIPIPVAVEAAKSYAERLLGETHTDVLDVTSVSAALDTGEGVWKAVETAFESVFDSRIDKGGFAKELIDYVEKVRDAERRPTGLRALEKNFGKLIADLARLLHDAGREEAEERQAKRVRRLAGAFLKDHPDAALKDSADQTLRDIASGLEDGEADEAVRQGITTLRREFKLGIDPMEPISDFDRFREELGKLHYRVRFSLREGVTGSAGSAGDSH